MKYVGTLLLSMTLSYACGSKETCTVDVCKLLGTCDNNTTVEGK